MLSSRLIDAFLILAVISSCCTIIVTESSSSNSDELTCQNPDDERCLSNNEEDVGTQYVGIKDILDDEYDHFDELEDNDEDDDDDDAVFDEDDDNVGFGSDDDDLDDDDDDEFDDDDDMTDDVYGDEPDEEDLMTDKKETKKECSDGHELCKFWAESGECEANPNYMLDNCKDSCGTCEFEDLDLGVDQTVDGDKKEETRNIISLSHDYIRNVVLKDDELRKLLELCKNEHELCSFWAVLGECDANPSYMKKSCSLACRSCDYHDIKSRCPLDPNVKWALEPGDLNKMFERITDVSEGSEYAKYEPLVHSRPYRLEGDERRVDNELDYKVGPWVVTFESFLTDEECDRLVEMGDKKGYERSTNVGRMKVDGTHERDVDNSRTSENSWCDKECDEDSLISAVTGRIANVTGIPEINQEYLQLLKYEEGQYYKHHHDYIENHLERQVGPRVLTFFLYLNDVEEGGGTKFNDMNIISEPKKGKAVLWPSVKDSDPSQKEYKTHHEALAVVKGVKYGANSWIHLHDFKGPFGNACV